MIYKQRNIKPLQFEEDAIPASTSPKCPKCGQMCSHYGQGGLIGWSGTLHKCDPKKIEKDLEADYD